MLDFKIINYQWYVPCHFLTEEEHINMWVQRRNIYAPQFFRDLSKSMPFQKVQKWLYGSHC